MPLPAHHAPFAEIYRGRGDWITGATPDWLRLHAASAPQRLALFDRKGAMTYGELDAAVRRLAAGFIALGVGVGDAIAVQLPNWREFVLVQQAALRIGAVYVPLLPQLRAADLAPMLQACAARLLVTPSGFRGFDYPVMARELAAGAPNLQHLLFCEAGEGEGSLDAFMEVPWEAQYGAVVDAFQSDPDAPRVVLFTSGTESRPKGVAHSYNTLYFGMKRHVRDFGLGPTDVVMAVSPVGHGTGAVNGVEFALMLGAAVVLLDAWSPAAALDAIVQHRATLMWGAATFYGDLVRAAAHLPEPPPAFRWAFTAGAPVPRALVADVRRTLGATLVCAFGQSEGQNITITRPEDPIDKIICTDGRFHAGIEWKLVDSDRQPVGPGDKGEIAYRGPNVCLGYLDPNHTATALDEAGFLYSGDLGVVDADGYLRIVGRRKDIIIRGGENISPAEVEDLLFGHPMIAQVSVIGYPDPRLGQRACAVVVPATDAAPTVADLAAHLSGKRVAKFKFPEKVVLVDALPATATGKVRKDVLRQRLFGGEP